MQERPLGVAAGRVEVEPSVAVEVSPCRGHSIRPILHAGAPGDVDEALSRVVSIEVLHSEVVRDDEVGPPIAVVVGE